MIKTSWILVILLNINSWAEVFTDDSEQIQSYINITLENHPNIKASRQVIKGSNSAIHAAKWGYFPTPSIEVSQGSSKHSTTFRFDQPLWTGGKLDASMDIATLQKISAEYQLMENEYALINSLLQNILNYQQALADISVLEDGKKQLLDLQAMLERRISGGVSSLSDMQLIVSRISSLQTELSSAYTRKDMAMRQIEIMSGVKPLQTFSFDSELIQSQCKNYEQIIEDIRTTHPTIKRLKTQTLIAISERDRAKSVLWPSVSLRAERINGSIYYDNSVPQSAVYVSLQSSPGAGFSAFSNVESAEAKILQSQFEAQSKERDLLDSAVKQFNTLQSLQERIEGLNQTISAAELVFDSYTRLFLAGKRQWLDLVNASRELTQYKTNLVDLKASYEVTAYQLALFRGKIVLELGNKYETGK